MSAMDIGVLHLFQNKSKTYVSVNGVLILGWSHNVWLNHRCESPGKAGLFQFGTTRIATHGMYTLHCTKKLLERIQPAIVAVPPPATTLLGNWYATPIFWRPQLVLLVSEKSLLPVLIPLAPAREIEKRFRDGLAELLHAAGIDDNFIMREMPEMNATAYAKTANRSLVGMMNEFTYLAGGYEGPVRPESLVQISLELAATPCKPIGYRTPMAALKQLIAESNA